MSLRNTVRAIFLVAGWNEWSPGTALVASVTAVGITATVTASTTGADWSTTDNGSVFESSIDDINHVERTLAGSNDPHAATLIYTPIMVYSDNLEFRYSRNKAALATGVNFSVQWRIHYFLDHGAAPLSPKSLTQRTPAAARLMTSSRPSLKEPRVNALSV